MESCECGRQTSCQDKEEEIKSVKKEEIENQNNTNVSSEEGKKEGEEIVKKKRRYVGRKKKQQTEGGDTKITTELVETSEKKGKVFRGITQRIPNDILENEELNKFIATALPSNYNFEIHKILHRVREAASKVVVLQFPEGLLMFGAVISDIIKRFVNSVEEVIIMGDVTYGACCIDDFTALAVGGDFLIHFGHSCLIPIQNISIPVLYVFVDIKFYVSHFVESIRHHFPLGRTLIIVGTIQFASSIQQATSLLSPDYKVIIPQARPLSPGELLGCTSPSISPLLEGGDADVIYMADGRFHLESLLIHNPGITTAYQYDPYSKKLTKQSYDIPAMMSIRLNAIKTASNAKKVGLILGTLGRQGSLNVFNHLESILNKNNIEYIIVLLSEIFPQKLELWEDVEAWVQVACPRLSIDWGYAFPRPLLSPYEAEIAFNSGEWRSVYPMDYYSKDGGPWSVYYKHNDIQS